MRLAEAKPLVSKQKRKIPKGFEYFDTPDKCFRAEVDVDGVEADLKELIEKAREPPSAIEWLNSAMLLSSSVMDTGLRVEALSLAKACCALANDLSRQEHSIHYKIAEAGCQANLSIIFSALKRPRDALLFVQAACLKLEEVEEIHERRSISARSDDGRLSLSNVISAKMAFYSHILLNTQYELGKYEDAARAFDDEFGCLRKPDISTLKDLDVADAQIALYLVDRW